MDTRPRPAAAPNTPRPAGRAPARDVDGSSSNRRHVPNTTAAEPHNHRATKPRRRRRNPTRTTTRNPRGSAPGTGPVNFPGSARDLSGPRGVRPGCRARHGIRRAPGTGAGCSHRPQGGSELHPRPGGTRHGHGEGRTGNGPGPSPRTNSGCNSDRRFRHGPGEERSVCGTGPEGASSFHASAWNEGLVTAPAGTCPERFGPGTGASRASEAEPARDRPGTEPGPVGTGPVTGTGEERTGYRNGARATGPSPNRDQ